MLWLYVAIGGALGSMARYGTGVFFSRFGELLFPYHTLLVNVLGSLLMGVLIGLGAHVLTLTQEWRAFLMVGILGGFTTFSSFSSDFVLLVEKEAYLFAGLYALLSMLLSLGAIFIGMYSIRLITA